MSRKNKKERVLVILESVAERDGKKCVSRYYTTKNKKNHPEKLELTKYNPYLRKRTVYREI